MKADVWTGSDAWAKGCMPPDFDCTGTDVIPVLQSDGLLKHDFR
jgi:hypothetical protein